MCSLEIMHAPKAELHDFEIAQIFYIISRLGCNFWIVIMQCTFSRLCKFLDCGKHIYLCSTSHPNLYPFFYKIVLFSYSIVAMKHAHISLHQHFPYHTTGSLRFPCRTMSHVFFCHLRADNQKKICSHRCMCTHVDMLQLGVRCEQISVVENLKDASSCVCCSLGYSSCAKQSRFVRLPLKSILKFPFTCGLCIFSHHSWLMAVVPGVPASLRHSLTSL